MASSFGGGAFCGNNQHFGHISIDYAMLLRLGAEGILDKVNARLADAVPGSPEHDELTAMGITLRGLMVIGERYADKAEGLARMEKDPDRKKNWNRLLSYAVMCPAILPVPFMRRCKAPGLPICAP